MADTERSTWEVWTYDVWGNATEGYEVNDRYCQERAREIDLPIVVNNAGTPHEFKSATPADRDIRAIFGLPNALRFETDGDDTTIYVERARDWYPIGELICTSHASLSPIIRAVEEQS